MSQKHLNELTIQHGTSVCSKKARDVPDKDDNNQFRVRDSQNVTKFLRLGKNPQLFIYMNLVGACEAFEQVSIDELATDFEDFAFMSDGDDEMPMG